MQTADVQAALTLDMGNPAAAFTCLSTVSRYVFQYGASDRTALDAIIRLRDWADRGVMREPALNDAVFSLCREAGLFPYLPEQELTWRDKVAKEVFRAPAGINYVFHREQWIAFQHLLSGKSLVLSAPTSFGKSVLIHAFIAQRRPACVVVVVPTVALLDQFRRRLSQYFGGEYVIITRNDQKADATAKRIFVLTQERLLDREDITEVDLLAIDEYYKLDTGRDRQGEGSRTVLLNVALRRYLETAKQIFFLGPTVAGIEMREEIKSRFVELTSDYSTVAVDIHDHSSEENPSEILASLLKAHGDEKSLIFSKSPPAARRLAAEMGSKSPLRVAANVAEFADWLAENYHPMWPLVRSLRLGYGLHHGAIPRSVAQALVRMFNESDLNALICTSTLIEGVNTAAKNVFIFDKKISNTNFDYFDFRNIAGRSGRMGHHFVGRIFLFHDPPPAAPFQLEIPALGDERKLSDAVLVNLSDERLSVEARARRQSIFDGSSLPEDLLKQFAPYGIVNAENMSNFVRDLLKAGDRRLIWRGHVGYVELLAVFEIAWSYLRFNKARMTAKEAAFLANRLRGSRTLRAFFDGLVRGVATNEQDEVIERGFRALSAFDYAVPKVLVDMEQLVNFHCLELGIEAAEYSYMAQSLDSCFSHHWVKALDEYGVPLPLGKRLSFVFEDVFEFDEAMQIVKAYANLDDAASSVSRFERDLINAALA